MRRAPIAAFLLGLVVSSIAARAEEALSLEGQMALPGVAGRIDHMAVDPARKRLLVAELGNGTLDVVDLASGRRVKQVAGLHEPQGVGYAQKSDLVVVASAGDGSVRFFRGEDLAPAGSLSLGNDADNVRVDPRTGYVIVGYGSAVAAVFRRPAKLVLLDTKTGTATQHLDTCGDADDVFFDAKRRRIYVSCGAGAVDVFQADATGYRTVARIETSSGARTSLFVPDLDRLYIAARAGLVGSDAAILVLRPLP